jgi:hypothetical protein
MLKYIIWFIIALVILVILIFSNQYLANYDHLVLNYIVDFQIDYVVYYTHIIVSPLAQLMSQPHFGLSVRVKPTLPKVRTWSPSGLLKI